MRSTVILFLLFTLISCAAFRQIEQTDGIGRIVKVAHYDGSNLKYLEEIKYVGNTYNPSDITYYNLIDSELKPFKKEIYSYDDHSIVAISIFSIENSSKNLINEIKFTYTEDSKIKTIEYYSFAATAGLYLFGLDQYSYENENISFRRIMEYQINSETGKVIQKAQYQVFYKQGLASSMKSGVVDSGSSSIIEKDDEDPEMIEKKIVSIEKYFLMKTIGRETIIK